MPPTAAPAPPRLLRPLADVGGFSLLGGAGTALLTQNLWAGAGAYYALLVLGLASPGGAPLRALGRRDRTEADSSPGSPVANENNILPPDWSPEPSEPGTGAAPVDPIDEELRAVSEAGDEPPSVPASA
jgi:hypothetical protein